VANAGDGEVNLSWNKNLEPDLKGYNVYSGTTAGSLTLAGFVDKAGSSEKITGLTNGTTYFFALDAEDTSGNKSSRTTPASATPKDTTAPTLISSAPANGATRVEPLVTVILNFSEPMSRDSFKLDCAVSGNQGCPYQPDKIVWSNGDRTATLDAASDGPPNYGATRTISVTGSDKAGNPLPNDTKIAFTIMTLSPKLVSSTPANGATRVKTDTPVIFNFNEPMDRASLALDCTVGGNTPCPSNLFILSASTWSDNDKTVNINVDGAFTSPLPYTLTVTARDKAGNALAPTPIHFTSNVPRLVSSTPANGAMNVDVNLASITFNFDEPMQENSLQLGCTFVANNASTQCGAQGSGYFDTPTWSNDDKTATFARHGGAFVPATPYRLEIIAARAGNGTPLADTAITFTTAEPPRPKLVSSNPADGATNVPANTDFVFTFSEPMQKDSVHFGETCPADVSCPSFGPFVWSNDDQTLSLKLTQPMTGGTDFALGVFGNDQAGNALDATVVRFTTIGPKLVSSTPANGATNASVNTDLMFTFSTPMQKDSFKLRYKCQLGGTCPGFEPPVWSNNDQTVSLKSKQRLETCTMYAFSLSAKDTAGRDLAPTSVGFTTEPPPGSQCS
jgi:Bacterial Ig-like domain